MHIEPHIVEGAKILLSYGTAATAFAIVTKQVVTAIKKDGLLSLSLKSFIATLLVFSFFEVFPHYAVGVSEVHLILGSTLFLLFGLASTGIALSAGLLLQGVLFAQFDLPQYGMNVTTLLLPLYAMSLIANKIIPENVAYKDVTYGQALKLSVAYQGGIVAWVGFWAVYGQGIGAENITQVFTFGAAYMTVIILEPLVDLGVLAGAKIFAGLKDSPFVEKRLYSSNA